MNEYEQDPNLEAPGNPDGAADFAPAVPAPPARDPVGELLKTAREAAGLTGRDVAGALNIRYVYIQALEESEYTALPGTTYALGFLRTYCQHLGLDVEELIQRYKEEQAGLDHKPELVFPTPVPESKVPGAALILVSVLLVGLAYGAWTFFTDDETAIAELVPAVPQRLQNLVDEEESEAPASPEAGETASAMQSGGVASLPNTTSPIFVLPLPDEEGGEISVEPLESAADVPVPESAAAAPEADTASLAQAPEPAPAEVPQAEPPAAETTQAQAPEEPVAEQPAATDPEAAPAESLETQIETAEPLAEPEPELAAATTVAEVPEVPEVIRAPEPAAVQSAAIPEQPAAETIPSAPATETPAPGLEEHVPKVYGAANANPRIVLRAIQDSWVQVRDSQDSLLLTRLLRAGDSYRVPNRTDLTMLTGNAGGLQIEIDGNTVGTLGPVGKVRRDVTLDPRRLLQDPNLTR